MTHLEPALAVAVSVSESLDIEAYGLIHNHLSDLMGLIPCACWGRVRVWRTAATFAQATSQSCCLSY